MEQGISTATGPAGSGQIAATGQGPVRMLVDNGSLRAESTLNLRRIARDLAARAGCTVHPVSLLHSSAVDSEALEGKPARIFEPFVKEHARAGHRRFEVLPLFFGPSRALTEYIPQCAERLQRSFPGLEIEVAPPLAGPEPDRPDPKLAALLADAIRETLRENTLHRPPVILVDHGSPLPALAGLRDRLAESAASLLGGEVSGVQPASMERREGPEYAFCEPLLEGVLRDPVLLAGPVVLAMLFLNPGRHAGKGGDVDTICANACAERPGLRVHRTRLLGAHPGLVAILAERLASLSGRSHSELR
jgi:sirohydrochlorin ferrochelatase